jgi:GNAT superfamily N-acetyltransferase
MSEVQFPQGYRLERLDQAHNRKGFASGQRDVDSWLRKSSLKDQEKHLSVTKVLLDESGEIAGFYTLAPSQVDFSELPPELSKQLPRRVMRVVVLSSLGVRKDLHGQGLRRGLFAQALRDCDQAGQSFDFIGVILNCADNNAKAFGQYFDFAQVPGYPFRLFVSSAQLKAILAS